MKVTVWTDGNIIRLSGRNSNGKKAVIVFSLPMGLKAEMESFRDMLNSEDA